MIQREREEENHKKREDSRTKTSEWKWWTKEKTGEEEKMNIESETTEWGNKMDGKKEQKMMRIYYQNVNSLGLLRRGYEVDNMCIELHRRKVDVLCLAETNLDWKKREVVEMMKQKIAAIWDHVWVQGSSSEEKMKTEFKPGGAVTIIGGNGLVQK